MRAQLERMDELLRQTDIEYHLVAGLIAERNDRSTEYMFNRHLHGLRCCIARRFLGESYRDFAFRLADSELLKWFTHCDVYGRVQPASKSTIERYDKVFSHEELDQAIHSLNRAAAQSDPALRAGQLNVPLSVDDVFADCTCVKAPIHFPVDWVLLRDAVRTLVKAIVLIRNAGLKHRIAAPETFLRTINKYCMEMSAQRRQPGAKKNRKKILRKMKKLAQKVASHARRYQDLLNDAWAQTTLSKQQAAQIIERMKNILDQLPAAIKQAHERIIGERRVANDEKILSLYDEDVQILVRGKSGAEVEFGNKLYLCEQVNGVIVDWAFYTDSVPSDSTMVKASVTRLEENHGPLQGYTGDRGFSSAANSTYLTGKDIADGLCPKNPNVLKDRMEDPWFRSHQKRRSGTEGRIGIFRNAFLGTPLRDQGSAHRKSAISWCVLTHNLWVIARMSLADEAQRKAQAA